jgi:cyclopropane-fatty-acyl-phospholipid synthase
MKSRIYHGQVMHARVHPVRHHFRYPVYTYAFDLDELPELHRKVRGFSYNRLNLVSLHDKDYLRGEGSIKEKLLRLLTAHGVETGVTRIELLTGARYFNYVFNPVSFYYCYQADGRLRCTVAEVNNTFSEKHVYILDRPLDDQKGHVTLYRHDKEFHVSPFMSREGHYDFRIWEPNSTLRIQLDLFQQGRRMLLTQLTGMARPLTTRNLHRTIRRQPLTAVLTVARIHWQAARLYFQRKLPLHTKPVADSPGTIAVKPPSRLERLYCSLVARYLHRLAGVHIPLNLPGGERMQWGDPAAPAAPAITVRRYRCFRRMALHGSIGFGEGYVENDWHCDDLTAVLAVFARNIGQINRQKNLVGWALRPLNRLRHVRRRNTRPGSRRNIAAHYDLSNDFFRTFLDDSMMYSAAFFRNPTDSLEEAQRDKIRRLLEMAGITADDHVLEIGSGWGGFAIQAARETGCRVTSVTLSREQLSYARTQARQAGLDDRISFQLLDYRDITGTFDKIVSIEMLEAVGHEFFGEFFATCDRLLAPGGRLVLQVITIPDQRYDNYRRNPDWIQKYIFPGGLLPSLTELCRAMSRHSHFVIDHLENIGPHYARTLLEWRHRFEAAWDDLKEMGYDERFRRMWRYYLCYCEAGFAARIINNLQLVLARPGQLRSGCAESTSP